jgi:hypothetical protein
MLTLARLPFRFIESPQFQDVIRYAQSAPLVPSFPSARTIQRDLRSTIQARQKDILQMLPPFAKLSIALDCWTSPFQQAFMAISGYFLDQEWNYRELLLGFEPLEGSHTGRNLSLVLSEILQKNQISDRIVAITTDNASNNATMIASVQETFPGTTMIQIPCIAHVIQLSLKQLLGHMKADPQNEVIEVVWSEERARQNTGQDIANTLNKV